jgi:DNA polymerase-4
MTGPDDTGCHILHVDMDAFYASVEILGRPGLAGRPVVVGGRSPRSVVLSASYPARAFGVRSAMPMSHARRLCPQAVIVPPDHGRYATVSRQVMAILRSVTPFVEPLSLDEAFLDVSGAARRLGPPARIAAQIRAEVSSSLGLTCSVGVGTTKFIAKLACRQCKPDGLLVVPAGQTLDFLHPLPVSALWGVGAKTGKVFDRLGLRSVGDVAAVPIDVLVRELGAAVGTHLALLARGQDSRAVVPHVRQKSVGAEETFPRDISSPAAIRRELLRLSARTAASLRASGLAARTVSVKLRLASFRTVTRSRTLPEPTDVAQQIYRTACALYAASGLAEGTLLRLVGVRASGLLPASVAASQPALGEHGASWREAERAMDRIAGKFGTGIVRPAALLAPSSPSPGGAVPRIHDPGT